jgi:hypothetical protein
MLSFWASRPCPLWLVLLILPQSTLPQVVRSACEAVMASKGLALVLQQMLVVGNLMNEGSRKGQASGITLESLLKLIHTKGTDKKTTVLDYVIGLCLDKVRWRRVRAYIIRVSMAGRVFANSNDVFNHSLFASSQGHHVQLKFPSELSALDPASRTPAKDVARELGDVQKQFAGAKVEARKAAEEAQEAASAAASAGVGVGGGGPADPARWAELVGRYSAAVGRVCADLEPQCAAAGEDCAGMEEAVGRLALYFGEDPAKCLSEKVFSALKQFIDAFKLSKEKV